jgi:OOP family OmpA-OmpF porin
MKAGRHGDSSGAGFACSHEINALKRLDAAGIPLADAVSSSEACARCAGSLHMGRPPPIQPIHFQEYQMKPQHLASLALLALSTTAFADGFYGVGEVTHSSASLDRAHFDSALTTNGAASLSSSDSGSSNKWRLQGGYRFNPNLAVEAGYIDFGKAKYTASYTGGSAQGSLKAGGVDVAALLSLPVNDSFSVFGKAGVVAASVKSSLTASGVPAAASGDASTHVIRPLLGVGALYKLTDNVDLRADYDHVSGLGKSNKTGKMNANLFSLGIAYNF